MCRAKVQFLQQGESESSTSNPFLDQNNLDQKILDFKPSLSKRFENKVLRCSDAHILLNVALFGKPGKDKVKMNERDMKSLKNISKHLLSVLEFKKRRMERRNLVEEEDGHESLRESRAVLAK